MTPVSKDSPSRIRGWCRGLAIFVAASVSCAWLNGPSRATAQEQPPRSVGGSLRDPRPVAERPDYKVRRVHVPAGQPTRWPPGDRQPLPLADFERLLTAARNPARRPSAAHFELAEYTATLANDTLRGGKFELAARRNSLQTEVVVLDPLHLAIAQLAWSDRPAIWGTTPQGQTALLIDRESGRAVGDWSLGGRRVGRSLQFDIRVAPATTTRLTLRLPDDRILRCSTGDPLAPQPAAEAGWSVWRIELGSQTSCQLTVSRRPPRSVARPLILARSDIAYAVRQEAVRFKADCSLEVLEAPLQEVRFHVEPDVQIIAISYGDGAALDWQPAETPQGRQIVVRLPDPLLGPGLPIRIQGITRASSEPVWMLPQLRPVDAVQTEGQLTLNVQPPLKVADLKTDGYRQIDLTTSAVDGETMVLRQLRPDATAGILLSNPRFEASCRVLTEVQTAVDPWKANSRVEWAARSGSAFSTTCRFPADWEVTDVTEESPVLPPDLTGWDVAPLNPDRRTLVLFFREALSPENPKRVRVSVRRQPAALNQPVSLPVIVPLESDDVEMVVSISGESTVQPVLVAPGSFDLLTVQDQPQDGLAGDFWKPLADRGLRSLLLRARNPTVDAQFALQLARDPVDVEATVVAASNAPQAALVPQAVAPLVATMLRVTARLSLQPEAVDVYRADYELRGFAGRDDFRWRLPAAATLVEAMLDGRRVVPTRLGHEYRLPPPDETGAHTVQIQYRVPCRSRFGPNMRPLALPETPHSVLGFEMNLWLPANVRLADEPAASLFAGVDPQYRWMSVLCGPLAPDSTQGIFNPLHSESWRRLFATRTDQSPAREVGVSVDETAATTPDLDTVGWRIHRAVAARPPANARLVLWNASQAALLAWAALLFCLMCGVLWRAAKLPRAGVAAACGIAGAVLAALTLPGVYAEIGGGCFVGLLVAAVLPRRILARPRGDRLPAAARVPPGSTQSFAQVSAGFLLATSLTWAICASAQEGAPAQRATVASPRTVGDSAFDVLIPVGPDGKPAGKSPLAFVPAPLLAILREMQPQRDQAPAWLISSAEYEGRIGDGPSLRIAARYDVQVLATQGPVRVELLLTGVNLGGDDACRLDGQPHPVLPGVNGQGLVVELPGGAAPHKLELRLHVPVESDVMSSRSKIGIPPVAASRIIVLSSKRLAVLEASIPVHGEWQLEPMPEGGTRLTGRLGNSPGLTLRWSDRPALPPPPAEVQATVSCVVDVNPALVQLRYHVQYRVLTGEVDALVWRLPADTGLVVRSVRAADLLGYTVDTAAGQRRRLSIEFARPQSETMAVTATFAIPVNPRDEGIRIPAMDLFSSRSATCKTTVLLNQIAFRQPPDFRLDVSVPRGVPLKPRSVDEFLAAGDAAALRPQTAYLLDSPVELALALQALAPSFQTRDESIVRVGRDRLDVTFQAEVETQSAPAFRYRLRVDPRLRITAVSVQEGGAERLLRWSRAADQVIVFLSDKTTGLQTLRLQATMPLQTPREFELPLVRFAGAATTEATLALWRDVELLVELPANKRLTQIETEAGASAPQGRDVFVGRFELPADPSAAVVRVERKRMDESRPEDQRVPQAQPDAAGGQPGATATAGTPLLPPPGAAAPRIAVPASTDGKPVFWSSRRDPVRLLIALLVAAATAVLGLQRPVQRGVNWVQRHEAAAWAVLGTGWWLCLAASWFGIVVVLFAGIRGIMNRRRPNVLEGSTARAVSVPR